tara:strand:- start:2324 stop:2521 length:198 start_codon:yes stop_codon:yes gene_type:complete
MKTKLYYDIYWTDCSGKTDKIATTDNLDKWLEENNEERIADGFDPDELDDFIIEECEACIYEEIT